MGDRPDPDPGGGADREAIPGRPRWQKVIAIVGLLVAILVAIMLSAGGGHTPRPHGAAAVPGTHMAGDAGHAR